MKHKTSPIYITRFIAALMVLVYHYMPNEYRLSYPGFHNFAEPVNYFFFISGFVMIISNKKNLDKSENVDKLSFWIKRLSRIYPMYLLALLLFVGFNYFVTEIDPSIPKRVWFEILGIQRWFYDGSVNYPAWTISCEFFFYFFFPWIFWYIIKNSLNRVLLVFSLFFIFNLLISYYFHDLTSILTGKISGKVVNNMINSLYSHPVFRFSVFCLGCVCGLFYLKYSNSVNLKKYSLPVAAISLTLIISIVIMVPKNPLIENGILSILYFPFILSLCNLPDGISNVLSNKLFLFLGEISYGMYILQAPIEHYFEAAFTKNETFTTQPQFYMYVVVLILISSLLYKVFEKPLQTVILRTISR